jgi:hypothetical protein
MQEFAGNYRRKFSIPVLGITGTNGKTTTKEMTADHIFSKPNRFWYEVEIKDYTEMKRPSNQGGIWFIANKMKIIREVKVK